MFALKMKLHLSLLSFVFLAEMASAQNAQERAANDEVRNFTFADRYGGCDEAIDGRWFLHFKPDGSIRIGLWSTEESRTLKYHADDQGAHHVDLSDVYDGNPKWRRIGPFTLEIKNSESIYLFTLVPNYKAGNSSAADNFIKFFEVGGQGRVFEIGFIPEYESDFKQCRQFR